MERYQYKSLPSRSSIRLLHFHKTNSGDLNCGFVFADTRDPPKYGALSYVWGDASDTVPISLDGCVMQITRNLNDALKLFGGPDALIWADALCINQEDNDEKSHQVNMMATIYCKAAIVTVWLGPDEHGDAKDILDDIKALVEGLGSIHTLGGHFKHFDVETGDLHWEIADKQRCVSALPGAIVDPDEEGSARLGRFFRLTWFTRTWILQEVGLAREAVLIWGGLAIPWNAVGLCSMFLLRYCRVLLDKLRLTADVERACHSYTAFSPFQPRSTFFHLMCSTRRHEATNPRDKVFALLSHPTSHTISTTTKTLNWDGFKDAAPLAYHFLPSVHDQFILQNLVKNRVDGYSPPDDIPPSLLQANYDKSVNEIYQSLALDLISRTESLEILTAVQHDPSDPSKLFIPSWVPRWDYFLDTPTLGFYNSDHSASSNRSVIVTSSSTPNSLTVRGHLVSRIIHHTPLFTPSSFDISFSTPPPSYDSPELNQQWENNAISNTWNTYIAESGMTANGYPILPTKMTADGRAIFNQKASNVFMAYNRTWVAGKNMGELDEFALDADATAYWEKLRLLNSKSFSSSKEEDEHKVKWQRYKDSAAYVCNQRRFFITKKGFFGLGPGAMQESDHVAVLLGADVPFVVREVCEDGKDLETRLKENKPIPMDCKFQLIGECYVDGLMQGQATMGIEFRRDILFI